MFRGGFVYRIIVVLKNLILEIKRTGKTIITESELESTMTYKLADDLSKRVINGITNEMANALANSSLTTVETKAKVYQKVA